MNVHVPAGYASEQVEKDLKIELQEFPRKHLDHARFRLRKVADLLGEDALDVQFPQKGLLADRLTDQQRESLNQVLTPIYAAQNAEDQKNLLHVNIEESGEPMRSLEYLRKRRDVQIDFSDRPIHDACGSWAGQRRVHWLRAEVAEEILKLFKALNHLSILPRVEDCWRHEEVQRGLLTRRVIELAREHEAWDVQTVKTVAMSLTAPSPGLAGHQAGAAIDWRLSTMDGKLFDLGNDYAEGGAVSSMDFPYLTFRQWETRTLFAGAMNLAGFKILYTEDWHGSRRDRGLGKDRRVTMDTAYYGPIQDFDRDSGDIVPYDEEDIDAWYLSDKEIALLVDESRKRVQSKGGKHHHTLAGLLGLLHSFRKGKRRKRSSDPT